MIVSFPLLSLANNLRGFIKNARDVAAQTLVDKYDSKDSVVTKQQEVGILDLSRQLNGPGFSTIESDIVSASSIIAAKSEGQARELPPGDEDDEFDEEIDDVISEEDNANDQTKSLFDLVQPEAPEKSLISMSSKIISMGKGLLKAVSTLTG